MPNAPKWAEDVSKMALRGQSGPEEKPTYGPTGPQESHNMAAQRPKTDDDDGDGDGDVDGL